MLQDIWETSISGSPYYDFFLKQPIVKKIIILKELQNIKCNSFKLSYSKFYPTSFSVSSLERPVILAICSTLILSLSKALTILQENVLNKP